MAEPIFAGLAPLGGRGGGVGASYEFVERLFIAALRNGIERFTAEPRLWLRILRFLDEQEIATVQAVFAARPPAIRAGYATSQDPMPVISVALSSETATDEFLGDLLEVGADIEELGRGVRGHIEGAVYEQVLSITIYADHPDVCLYLYHWVRYVLQAHGTWFLEQGLIDPTFRSGAEVHPENTYLPERLFARVLTWTVKGVAVSVEPMPPPPRRLFVFLPHVNVEGHQGGATPVTGGE